MSRFRTRSRVCVCAHSTLDAAAQCVGKSAALCRNERIRRMSPPYRTSYQKPYFPFFSTIIVVVRCRRRAFQIVQFSWTSVRRLSSTEYVVLMLFSCSFPLETLLKSQKTTKLCLVRSDESVIRFASVFSNLIKSTEIGNILDFLEISCGCENLLMKKRYEQCIHVYVCACEFHLWSNYISCDCVEHSVEGNFYG